VKKYVLQVKKGKCEANPFFKWREDILNTLEFLEEAHICLASQNISEQIHILLKIQLVSKKVSHEPYGNIGKFPL